MPHCIRTVRILKKPRLDAAGSELEKSAREELQKAVCIHTLFWDLKEKGAVSFGSILLFQVEAVEALVRNAQFCE